MGTTNRNGIDWITGQSFFPQSRLFWVGFTVSIVLLFVGGMIVTGPIGAMMGILGITVLFVSVVGYAAYRLWYRFGA